MVTNDEFKYYHKPETKAKLETWYAASSNEVWMVVRNGISYTVTRSRAEVVNGDSISEVDAKVVTVAFHKAIQQWINLMPEALRPAGMTTATCKCGCGEPPATKSDYATSACRVRFFRKEKRAGAQKVTPKAPTIAEPADLVIVDREWFKLTYRYMTDAKLWELRLVVDGGEKSATKEGFKALSEIVYLHADYLLQRSLEMAKCALIVDYRYQDYPYLLWNITQHFALYPDPKVLTSSDTRWHTLANLRVNKAASLMPITMGTVDRFVALLTGKSAEDTKAEAPKVTPKAAKETNRVTLSDKALERVLPSVKPTDASERRRFEKLIIKEFLRRESADPKHFEFKYNIVTHVDGFKNDPDFNRGIENAWKRMIKDGRIIHNNDPGNWLHRLSDDYLASLKAPVVTPEPTVDPVVTEIEGVLMQVFNRFEQPNMTTFRNTLTSRGFDVTTKEGKSNIEKAIENLILEGLIKRKGLQFIKAV